MKAKHLVIALSDHFMKNLHSTPSPESAKNGMESATNDDGPYGEAEESKKIHPDAWATVYITVERVRHLIEAIDDDVSSFVTIAEINRFTAARPTGWRYAVTSPKC